MNSAAAWKPLLRSVSLFDLINGYDVEFGSNLVGFYQELLQYEWPREAAPLQLGEALGMGGSSGFLSMFTSSLPAAYSFAGHQLANSPAPLRPTDDLLVWLLIHTQDTVKRKLALHWLSIIAAARLAARSLASPGGLARMLSRNLSAVAGAVNDPDCTKRVTFRCLCGCVPTEDMTLEKNKPRALCGTRHASYSRASLAYRMGKKERMLVMPRWAGRLRPAFGPSLSLQKCAFVDEHCGDSFVEVVMSSAIYHRSEFSSKVYERQPIRSASQNESAAHRRGAAPGSGSNGVSARALLIQLECEINSLRIDFCEELYTCMQNAHGWSTVTLVKYYEICSAWHTKLAVRDSAAANMSLRPTGGGAASGRSGWSESGGHRHTRPRTMTMSDIQPEEVEEELPYHRRRGDVLTTIYYILRTAAPLINDMLSMNSRERLAEAMKPEKVEEYEDYLRTPPPPPPPPASISYSPASTSSLLSPPNPKSRLLAAVVSLPTKPSRASEYREIANQRIQRATRRHGSRVFWRCLNQELRCALLSLCGSSDCLYALAWVDATSVTIIESLGCDMLEENLRWLKVRWTALDLIHQLYGFYDCVHKAVPTASQINKIFRKHAPRDTTEPFQWLVSVLSRLYSSHQKLNSMLNYLKHPLLSTSPKSAPGADDRVPPATERIKGLAALVCEADDEQKSRSDYWVHIHPLIHHLIDPNYTDVQKIGSIPFDVHVKHVPIFRQIVLELLAKCNAGPPEFAEAYTDCILYSALREYSSNAIHTLEAGVQRARGFWLWEEFREFMMFHEKCYPTRLMLDDRPAHYAEEFMRHQGRDFVDLPSKQALATLRKLSKSARFIEEIDKRTAVLIQLV